MGIFVFLVSLVAFSSGFCDVLVIYEHVFEKDFAKLKTTQAGLRLLDVAENDSLASFKSRFHSAADFTKVNTVFSFSNKTLFLQNRAAKFYLFGNSVKSLISSPLFQKSNSSIYTTIYKHVVISVIYSLRAKRIAVIIDDSFFSSKFYETLEDFNANSSKKLELTKIVCDEPCDNIQTHFYNLKTGLTRMIVVLTSLRSFGTIKRLAQHFGLTTSAHTWLIPTHYDETFEKVITVGKFPTSFRRYFRLDEILPRMLEIATSNNRLTQMNSEAELYHQLISHQMLHKDDVQLTVREVYNDHYYGKKSFESTARVVDGKLFYEQPMLHLKDNMARRSIRAVTIIDAPFAYEDFQSFNKEQETCRNGVLCSNNGKLTCCVGFIISLFQLIADELEFDVDMYVVEDNKYGAVEDDGRWNGMIADVAYEKADIAVAGLTISSIRSKVVDFTASYLEQEVGMLTKPSNEERPFLNWEFSSLLTYNLKIVLGVAFLVAIFLNWIFENNKYFIPSPENSDSLITHYDFSESFSYISGVTIQRDLGGKSPGRFGARFFVLVFAFGMVILTTTYTAMLAAQSVQNKEMYPFTGSTDPRMRNPTDAFKIATVRDSFYETFFKEAESDVLKRMGMYMEKYNVATDAEGTARVKNGSLDAFLSDYLFSFWYVSQDNNCELRLFKDTLAQGGYGFAVRKEVPWLPELDEVILRMKASREVDSLQKNWFAKFCQPQFFVETKMSFGVNHFGGLVVILAASCLMCFVLKLPGYALNLKNVILKKIKANKHS